MITAKIVADSLNEHGNRITTMEVVFPRFILAELNTHRMFSRNSASSRAIPFEKMVKMVQENPFVPIAWQKDHKGMQGNEYFNEEQSATLRRGWLTARDNAIDAATALNNCRVTKQLCNRLLEPFMWHKVLITATEWGNFFELRCPQYKFQFESTYGSTDEEKKIYRSRKDLMADGAAYLSLKDDMYWLQLNKGQAEIHMMALAEAMWDAYQESTPKQLKSGEWHVPFGDQIDWERAMPQTMTGFEIHGLRGKYPEDMAIKIATARCARISYTTVGEEDKPANYANDIKLHDRLLESKHMSPFEHCARAMSDEEYSNYIIGTPKPAYRDSGFDTEEEHGWCRNLRGWIQYRHLIETGGTI